MEDSSIVVGRASLGPSQLLLKNINFTRGSCKLAFLHGAKMLEKQTNPPGRAWDLPPKSGLRPYNSIYYLPDPMPGASSLIISFRLSDFETYYLSTYTV